MGCAASLAQVGPVEDPQRITHTNPCPILPASEIKSSPTTLENYLIPRTCNLPDSPEIAQNLNGGSGMSPPPLNINISSLPLQAPPNGPLLPISGLEFQISVDPTSLHKPSH
jgi:hypothetical protein